MKIFELKRQPDYCGFVALIQEVTTLSAVGRKLLSNLDFVTDTSVISTELDNTEQAITLLNDETVKKTVKTLYILFSEIKDIEKTLLNLYNREVMNDIELFEIKTFALNAKKIFETIAKIAPNGSFLANKSDERFSPSFDAVIKLLDPENSGVPTFYIYDAYSKTLATLRRQEQQKENAHELVVIQSQILEIEQEIRQKLSEHLLPYAQILLASLRTIAYIDLIFAKAEFAKRFELCKPTISQEITGYKGIFNPEVKEQLNEKGGRYQPVDIVFGKYPTLITGINMGGKTLMLKTLALSQLLFQYGFYVPAFQAAIAPVTDIMHSLSDEQNQLQGLSSFASEMKRIDQIIKTIETDTDILVLIDELARTTNPKEGVAIVSAMLEILQENRISSFITTHYDVSTQCRRLRVKGLKDNYSPMASGQMMRADTVRQLLNAIDYTLIDDQNGGTPNEAIRIAEMLGISEKLIDMAKKTLKKGL